MPGSWLSQYSPVNGRSVPFFCVTWYCSGDSAPTAAGFLLYSFATDPPKLATRTTSRWVPLVPAPPGVTHSSSPTGSHPVHDRDDLVGDDLWCVEHDVVAAAGNDHILRRHGLGKQAVRL